MESKLRERRVKREELREELQTPAPQWIFKQTHDGQAAVKPQALRTLLDETFGAEQWTTRLDAPAGFAGRDESTATATARVSVYTATGTIERSETAAVPIMRSLAGPTPQSTIAQALEKAATRAFARATACLGPRFGADIEESRYDALCERARQASERATSQTHEYIKQRLAEPVPAASTSRAPTSLSTMATVNLKERALDAHRIDPTTSETWYNAVCENIKSWEQGRPIS